MRRSLIAAVLVIASIAAPRSLHSQERGAAALAELIEGLGTTARVLMIGAHPDDEDTNLIAWLARGRHVETAYLSLTRGDGGQNLIGNELGEALGVIRTEELLAARRIDGGVQYFTRAYDFGFSKTVEDTYRHWPKDSVLKDVVSVVRAFRPHVIVAVFSGTTRDGHGHHQVSGMLAREAYEVAGSAAFATGQPAWTPLKFYRAARFNADAGTLRMNVGEYDHVLGRSYAEIAGESRSQHRSQGFGSLQRKGVIWDYVRREATRVNEGTDAKAEASLFDGIDTSLARLKPGLTAERAAILDSVRVAIADAQRIAAGEALHRDPRALLPSLARVVSHAVRLDTVARLRPRRAGPASCNDDACSSARLIARRGSEAFRIAAGVDVEALAGREVHAMRGTADVTTHVHNRGRGVVRVTGGTFAGAMPLAGAPRDGHVLRPDSSVQLSGTAVFFGPSMPAWLTSPRRGAMFQRADRWAEGEPWREDGVSIASDSGPAVVVYAPIVHRSVDPARGEIRREVAAVPAITLLLDSDVGYARANTPLDRRLRVELRNADTAARDVRVSLELPAGLTADSSGRTIRIAGGAVTSAIFRLRGRVAPGTHRLAAVAESDGERFTNGYVTIDYEHIPRRRMFRDAVLTLTAVPIALPRGVRVAYVQGVSDNVAPMLEQLGIPVAMLTADAIASADLSEFTAVVIGPRAYEAHPELAAANPRLFDWARRGGTLLVQYGQHEMQRPGMMPFPITLAPRADRVAEEDAAVTVLDAGSPLLASPNRIAPADFEGWVQERATYMPSTWDSGYRTVLGMSDTGEPRRDSGILWAPLGQGRYVYAPLAFFRQLPAAHPGAARLFVNLLAPAGAPQP